MYTIIQSNDYNELKKYVDEKILLQLKSSRNSCYELNNSYLISFRYCHLKNPSKKEVSVTIYQSSDELIFVTTNQTICDLIHSLDQNASPPQQLFDFFMLLTADDIYILEKFEDIITEIEERLLTEKKLNEKNLKNIMELKNKLLMIKRYYEQLEMILDILRENHNIFDKKLKEHFSALYHRIDKLLDFVLHLREYVTQVREAYQAQIDIEQNNIMRIFTVITTIFLPLTLIAGWYGMNLKMPEYSWDFGYLFVIAISAFISILSFIIFKIKKWF